MQLGEAAFVHLAQHFLLGVHILVVHLKHALDIVFFAFVRGHMGYIGDGSRFGVAHDIAHAFERGAHQFLHQLGVFGNRLVAGHNGLGHAFEIQVRRQYADLRSRVHRAHRPVGHRRHGHGLFGGKLLPHPGGASRLNVHVGLGRAALAQHAQQGVVGGVGVGNGGDGFAFEFAWAFNCRVLVADQLHQRASAQHRHGFDRYALAARDDGSVANRAANHCVARAYLLGHVHAAAPGNKIYLQSFSGVVAFGLRQHPRAEGGQHGGRR